jgi:glutathione S-transferase
VLDDGQGLTEGAAILQYVAALKPESAFAPKAGTMERVHLQEMLTYISSEVHKPIGSLFDKSLPQEWRNKTIDKIGKRFDWLTKHLSGKDYVMGATFTVADAYLFTVLNWCQWVGVDLAKWPTLTAFMARVGARPKVHEALKVVGLTK